MAEHGSPRRLAPGVVSLQDITTSAPRLRFSVRFPAVAGDEGSGAVAHDADAPHPLAGTGKLFLAVAVARLAERDPNLSAATLTIRAEHRATARSGTLRRMAGELQLTADDAVALIVGTGDGACTVALLELLETRGEDVLDEARRAVAELGLEATIFTGLEGSTDDRGGGPAGESWGEGLMGTTTAADLCTLLVQLLGASIPQADASGGSTDTVGDDIATLLTSAVADRVLGWMATTFEPAGLANALPGFGPRTIPHRTVSGFELLVPPGTPGWASVLILPADVGTGRPATCVAAYHPPTGADGSAVSSRRAGAVLGSLGLAAAVSPA